MNDTLFQDMMTSLLHDERNPYSIELIEPTDPNKLELYVTL